MVFRTVTESKPSCRCIMYYHSTSYVHIPSSVICFVRGPFSTYVRITSSGLWLRTLSILRALSCVQLSNYVETLQPLRCWPIDSSPTAVGGKHKCLGTKKCNRRAYCLCQRSQRRLQWGKGMTVMFENPILHQNEM